MNDTSTIQSPHALAHAAVRMALLGLLLACGGAAQGEQQAAGTAGLIVKCDNAAVRAGPDERAPIARRSLAAERVMVLRKTGEWVEVYDGWISARHLIDPRAGIAEFTADIAREETSVAYSCRARAHIEIKNFEAALADGERAVALDGYYPPAWCNRAAARSLLGKLDIAQQDYERALTLAPNYGPAHRGIGWLMLKQKRYPEGIAAFDRAAANGAGDVTTLSPRGVCYALSGQHRRAIDDFTRGIELCKDAQLYINRSAAYFREADFERALADANRAVQINPLSARAFAARANVCIGKKDTVRALEDIERSIKLDPKCASAYSLRAVLHHNAGRLDQAMADAEHVLTLAPADFEALAVRGQVLAGRGDFSAALDDLTKAVTLEPYAAVARSARGETLAALGRYAEAAKELEAAERLRPRSDVVQRRRAWLLATCPEPSVRDGKTALACAKRACELTRYGDARCLEILAAAYAETGDFALAVRHLKEALRLAPNNADLQIRGAWQLEEYRQRRPLRRSTDTPPLL